MTSDPRSLRVSGRGGQGALLAGVLLAEAGMYDGYHVVQTQSYGPEARLGASKAEVLLSRHEIAYPKVLIPDLLLCLSREAYVRYGAELAVDGTRMVEERVAGEVDVQDAILLPIMATAQDLGGIIVANMVALGALITLTNVVSEAGLRRAILSRVKEDFVDLNMAALEAGMALV